MQMDRVVQQNATLVEEATAATESMKEQAGSLLEIVSRFQLNDSPSAGAASRVASNSSYTPAATGTAWAAPMLGSAMNGVLSRPANPERVLPYPANGGG
jgi:methyl-accepting chemotaxis protein